MHVQVGPPGTIKYTRKHSGDQNKPFVFACVQSLLSCVTASPKRQSRLFWQPVAFSVQQFVRLLRVFCQVQHLLVPSSGVGNCLSKIFFCALVLMVGLERHDLFMRREDNRDE